MKLRLTLVAENASLEHVAERTISLGESEDSETPYAYSNVQTDRAESVSRFMPSV
ncbi:MULTISPECIES: hypothetical protein [Methylorubrum]|jgi:hypothetical protein|nr:MULTISPECIES: hypothetical protein [Methylorubrum]MCG5248962.1 hypothetical protein [Methylorubrum extorquens]MCY1641041.1 hypothetical protein [Methylorubrum sp. SL192]UYW27564.1 hypothetical protein OKC48_03305 [Methylorubrum extorquens]UYW32617.1 hypothetical protein OKB92_00340 [Methylorubrum extorquens]WIU42329.1 hypothetical protein KQ926_06945 [Methylorubrum extorquens]